MQIEQELPIFNKKQEIINSIQNNDITIVTGDTGCGKTTQVPKYILESLSTEQTDKLIGVTQPRRISAISVADRVSKELHSKLGKKVGYEIRFEHKMSETARIKFMTEGILLKELLKLQKIGDRYSHIIIDEAHERSINSDLILGIIYQQLRRLVRKRSKKSSQGKQDVKFIIMSATLESEKLIDFFAKIENIKTNVG